MTEQKKCSRCGETKPISEFGKHNQVKSGIDSWCKKCHATYNREYQRIRRATDPAYVKRISNYQKEWRKQSFKPKPCSVCGQPRESVQHKYCKNCAPVLMNCCDFLELHHDIYKDDPERLSTDFIKNLMHCKCEVEK